MIRKKSLLATGMACLFGISAHAQETTTDILPQPKEKKFEHRIGVQMNELIRQVFNFNNNTTPALNNPYLLTYSLTHAKSGLGIRMGVGPEYTTFNTDDGITKAENNVNRINARIGIEKVFQLSYRWSAGAGADFVYANDRSFSKSFVRSFDSTSTDIVSEIKSTGYGGMAWLQYHISPRILVGTEASFYYRTGNYKQSITITTLVDNFPEPEFETITDKQENKIKEGVFRLPMVFYLVVKF